MKDSGVSQNQGYTLLLTQTLILPSYSPLLPTLTLPPPAYLGPRVLPWPARNIVPDHNVLLALASILRSVRRNRPEADGVVARETQLALFNQHVMVAAMEVYSVGPSAPGDESSHGDVSRP